MYSKAFEKVFEAKVKPKIEEFPLENGVTKKINNESGMIDFDSSKVIDGLEYSFHLTKRKEGKDWNLGFNTQHGTLLTNKGLGVYKHIIDNLVVLVNTARQHAKIDRIAIVGAYEDLRVDEMEEFKKFLMTKTEKGGYLFDNFSYINQAGDWKKSLRIKDGQVFIDESGTRPLSIRERIKGEGRDWKKTDVFSIKQFIEDKFEMSELLNDKEMLSALMSHIGAAFSLDRGVDRKNSGKLRSDMYERTLKQKFPDYKFERKGDAITLFL